jgi:hypothetical protein
MTKKKNTGVDQSNQGHRAKMNSSDRSGFDHEDSGDWTTVISKSSRRKLQKKQRNQESRKDKSAVSEVDELHSDAAADEARNDVEVPHEDPISESESESTRGLEGLEQAEDGMQSNDTKGIDADAAEPEEKKSKKSKVTPSSSKKPKNKVVPETPPLSQAQADKEKKPRKVVKVNAADGRTMDELLHDLIKNSESVRPRDIDPSSQAPTPSLVQRVAKMLLEDPSALPLVELGVPDTKRRSLAKRLMRILGIKFMQAEKLLTASALSHPNGKENYVHALALGKHLKHGIQVEDGAEAHRIYLRDQVSKAGYTVQQVNMSLPELEASLGLLNITATDVQGWLVRQAIAYTRAQASPNVDDNHRPGSGGQKHPQVPSDRMKVSKAVDLLRARGMDDVTAGLELAAQRADQSAKKIGRPGDNADNGTCSNTALAVFGDLQKEDKEGDPFWNKPPAMKYFLLARQGLWERMREISTIPHAQLLRTLDSQIASWPTFLEAVQHFPKACGVKFEFSEFLQRQIEEANIGIRDLELGSRMFLADVLERGTDLILRHLDMGYSRKLVEAEFARAFKRTGDCNEAVQYVCKTLKAPSIPTPSWRDVLSHDGDTPRSLGAAYRLGQQETSGTSAKRKAAGRDTARLAAQQEKVLETSTPAKSSRYQNADAISTLRKMLQEDPELSNLPAEQQLRLAARRVNRRIDFVENPTKESPANKRNASQREDDSNDEEAEVPPTNGRVTLKGKRSNAPASPGGDGDGGSGSDAESAGSSEVGISTKGSSDASSRENGSGNDSEDELNENSDEEGSSCGSDDEDSRQSDEQYSKDDFCVDSGDEGDDPKPKKSQKKCSEPEAKLTKAAKSSVSKRASSVNSLGTPKKSEGTSAASQGGHIYFGEDELKKWTIGSEKYKQGFNWPAYIHHKQNYDNYCQFKGVHAARTFKSVIHARLVPALCGFCGLKRLLWKDYEDATVILAIENALRPSRSTDFALELKQIKIADDKELSLTQNYTAFFENFSCKVAEAEDANRSIKPNVVKSTFKTAVSGHEILKLWLEEVPWRGLNKANARLLRKLREVRSWEQLQRKGITSAAKKQRIDEHNAEEAGQRQEGRKTFRGKRAGKSYALKKRTVRLIAGRKGRNNYGAASSSESKRSFSKFNKESHRGGEGKRKHPGLDQRGETWHDDKDLFECFNSPCKAPFCQRCGRHGHTASDCRIPDEAPGINLRGYYQEEKKGKARLAGPPPRNNSGRAEEDSDHSEAGSNSGKNNAQRGSSRRCLQ